MEPVSHFEQDILRKNHPPIRLTIVYDYALTVEHVADFRATMTGPAVIGVAPAFGVNGAFRAIAFASSTDVLLLRIGTTTDLEAKRTAKLTGLNRLADDILSNPALTKVAFRSEVLASALFLDLYLRVAELLDLFSLAGTQQPPTIVALLSKLVDGNGINMRKARDLFRDDAYNMQDPNRMAMRAWVAQAMAATHCRASLGRLPKLDNRVHHTQSLTTLSILVRQAHQLDALKPQTTKNDVEHDFKMEDGKLLVKNTRYKTRLQASPTQVVHVETVCQGRRTIHEGRVGRVRGHAATIDVKTNIVGQDISITTVGKDPATNAQRARQEIVWRAFHRQISLDCLPFFSKIWSYPKSSVNLPPLPPAPSIDYSRPLNDSQKTAIDAILSDADENRLVMIHGPPGTGKTTVISAAVNSMSKACPDRGIWLLAQSNVAVKNIAEKLASIDFLKFKLLVSEGFHFEWHEHLYDKISDKVILSDEFPTDLVTAENALLDARVILCTLSMMSSSHISPIARVARVQTVIIDEASQIQIGDYIPLLQYFKATLAKLVFIGDDKQRSSGISILPRRR
ncbi:P-loop containing nucleoside triphosphate hydrolase protein [Dentipellis sp. KUC8613]|nr:P-loop containing nucleoside triphosphate hydrolase protein [Dentipellis sp. KUC8613]